MSQTDEDRTNELYRAVYARIEAAAVGQPAIVREAMLEGVARCRVGLTDKDIRRLYKAVKAGWLTVAFTGPLGRVKMFICDPQIAFGGPHA